MSQNPEHCNFCSLSLAEKKTSRKLLMLFRPKKKGLNTWPVHPLEDAPKAATHFASLFFSSRPSPPLSPATQHSSPLLLHLLPSFLCVCLSLLVPALCLWNSIFSSSSHTSFVNFRLSRKKTCFTLVHLFLTRDCDFFCLLPEMSEDNLQMVVVQAQNCGVLHVYVQGNLEERGGKTIILTVHDIGTNREWIGNFTEKKKCYVELFKTGTQR